MRKYLIILLMVLASVAGAADLYWTNNSTVSTYYDWFTPGYYNPSQLPTIDDSVWFTNNHATLYTVTLTNSATVANIYHLKMFSGGARAFWMTNGSTLTVTNSFVFGAGSNSINLSYGTLAITNSGNAKLDFGGDGRNPLVINGGVNNFGNALLIAESIFLTNSAGTDLTIGPGTVRITGPANSYCTNSIAVGRTTIGVGSLEILGGSNIINVSAFGAAGDIAGRLFVSGSSTYVSNLATSFAFGNNNSVGGTFILNSNAVFELPQFSSSVYNGQNGAVSNMMVVDNATFKCGYYASSYRGYWAKTYWTNGAKIFCNGINNGDVSASAPSNNWLIISDPGTVVTNIGAFADGATSGHLTLISNGAKVYHNGTSARIGYTASSGNSDLRHIVDGAGTVEHNNANAFTLGYGYGATNCVMAVQNGATFTTLGPYTITAGATASFATGNTFRVDNATANIGGVLTIGGVRASNLYHRVDLTNSATMVCSNILIGVANTESYGNSLAVSPGSTVTATNAGRSVILDILGGTVTVASNAVLTVDRILTTNQTTGVNTLTIQTGGRVVCSRVMLP